MCMWRCNVAMATRASIATSFAVVGRSVFRSDRGPFAPQFMSSKSRSSLPMDVDVAHGKARCASRSVTRSSEEGPFCGWEREKKTK